MIESTAVLLVQDQSMYVLQHRDNNSAIAHPGTYSTWGGREEPGDASHFQAAIRELKEETGIQCSETDLQDIGQGRIPDCSPDNLGRMVLVHYFILEIDAQTVVESLEGQGIAQLPIPYRWHPKVNPVAQIAIDRHMERYEAAA